MRKKYLQTLLFICVFFAYTFIIGCPLYRLTGIRCPFCGMTRAHMALICGDVQAAFGYNRLFFLGFPTVALIMAALSRPKRKGVRLTVYILLALVYGALLINYILTLCGI